jgi:two-component system, OmpR family, sensor histidine kinase SenX3
VVTDSVELASLRHHLAPGALRLGQVPADGVVVIGNREELRTVVANLLDNAVKYTGAEKDIVVDVQTPDIDSAVLRVRDNGVGIPRSELKRIFKRFYRIPLQVTSAVRGTGLGLFIVRSIVRRHGGEVIAESAGEGRGSTFSIRLPRVYRP